MNNSALIIANGELPEKVLINRLISEYQNIFVTDGAANHIDQTDKKLFICGDFDSIDRSVIARNLANSQLISLPDQNQADLEKTLEYASQQGIKQVLILGALGGRIDHSLSNLSLLLRAHENITISIVHQSMEMIIISSDCQRKGKWRAVLEPNTLLSLASYSTDTRVTLSGVHWSLEEAKLPLGTQGVSNRALGGEVHLKVHSGIVALSFCHTR